MLKLIYTLLLRVYGTDGTTKQEVVIKSDSSDIYVEQPNPDLLKCTTYTLDNKVGITRTITYYTGVVAGNPSGTTTNVATIVYTNSTSTLLTQTFTYNATDGLITLVNS